MIRMKNLTRSGQRMRRRVPHRPAPGLDRGRFEDLARAIMTALPDEIGCDGCFERMDRLAEMRMAGRSAVQVLPQVQDHLNRCPDCREEFDAVLASLRAPY